MPNIRSIDMMFLDDLLEMGSGYVLNFSNPTFTRFFADELNVDIDDPVYAENGTSKGRRLRCFLQKVDLPTVVRTLRALWEYREAVRQRAGLAESIENAQGRLLSLLNRLEGKPEAAQPAGQAPKPAFDRPKLLALQNTLISFAQLEPHARGYAFETLLRDLFNVYGLEAREPFRLKGEQIDGSFVLQGETYPSEMGLLFDLLLSHGAMEAIERSRAGQGVVLSMRIHGTAWHERKAEALQTVIDCRISQSDWLAALDQSGYGRALLFEVPLPASSAATAPSPAKYLQRAKAHLRKGHYDEVVATCRLALESLSDGSDATDAQARAMREFKGNPKALSLEQRELVLRQVAMNYTHLAHHHESDMELGRYDRSTATMVLGVTAALASRAVFDAPEL